MKTLSKEEVFEAIKQGVKEAFLEMMESGNGDNGPIRTEQIMESIKYGVYEAVFESMPDSPEIKYALEDGCYQAIKDSR